MMENAIEDKTFILEDRHAVEEMYKFVKALLADYSACKTELARTGLMKSLNILIDKIGNSHARMVDAKIVLNRELEATKAKLPKSKEEITKILHEAGFHELEEVEGGTWHGNVPSPELTPKQYAELYRRLYGEMTKADERKLDRDIKKMEEEELVELQAKTSTEILEANNDPDDSLLDPKNEITPEEFFESDKKNEDSKKASAKKEKEAQATSKKTPKKTKSKKITKKKS